MAEKDDEPPEPKAKEEPKEEPKLDDRPRDASGRFTPEEKEPEPPRVAEVPTPSAAPSPQGSSDFTPAPQAWRNEEKAIWNSLSPDVQKIGTWADSSSKWRSPMSPCSSSWAPIRFRAFRTTSG